jgi:hypothetical protein
MLGDRRFDITTRAIIVGIVAAHDDAAAEVAAQRLVVEGADALEAPTRGTLARRVDVPVLVSGELPPSTMTAPAGVSLGELIGTLTAAIVGGARIIRTADVRPARRVADVVAAILAARSA